MLIVLRGFIFSYPMWPILIFRINFLYLSDNEVAGKETSVSVKYILEYVLQGF